MRKQVLGGMLCLLAACSSKSSNDPTVTPIDSSSDSTSPTCNPLAQTGCNAGEKCTWTTDQDTPPIGHVGCAPEAAAPKAIGAVCTDPPAGPMGYDDCAKGSVCLSGECKQICDTAGGAPTCDAN